MHDIYFFTDIHGARPLFDAIMNFCKIQDPEATIIYGGDACDRGSDGYNIMKELLNNPKVLYLKGNHEDMFTKAARELKALFSFDTTDKERIQKVLNACKHFDYKYASIQDSLYNGGIETLTNWILDGMPMDIVERLEHLPLTFQYENLDFCHSAPLYKFFKEIYDKEYNHQVIKSWDQEVILWSRNTIDSPWKEGRKLIFGHTPVSYLSDFIRLPGAEPTGPVALPQKIDMDTGACFTNKAYVLNVITMKAQGFLYNKETKTVEEIDCIQF